MKVERVMLTSVVVIGFLALGLLVIGDSILQQKYGVGEPPAFATITTAKTNLDKSQGLMENETLSKSTETGQSDIDPSTDDTFYTYTRKSLRAIGYTFQSITDGKAGIAEILQYLKVHPLIIGFIGIFITLSVVFALVTWWKGKRP